MMSVIDLSFEGEYCACQSAEYCHEPVGSPLCVHTERAL